jgi:hypothetical protein
VTAYTNLLIRKNQLRKECGVWSSIFRDLVIILLIEFINCPGQSACFRVDNPVFDTGTPRPHSDRRQKDLEPFAIELSSYQLLALAVGPKGIPSEMASREK